jgi:hypothetical protein
MSTAYTPRVTSVARAVRSQPPVMLIKMHRAVRTEAAAAPQAQQAAHRETLTVIEEELRRRRIKVCNRCGGAGTRHYEDCANR